MKSFTLTIQVVTSKKIIPDAFVHFGRRHDHNTGRTWRIFLCKGCTTSRCDRDQLVAIGQFNDFCAMLLTWLWTNSMADDGRNFTSENSRFGCISCDRIQLVVHVYCDEIIRFINGYVISIIDSNHVLIYECCFFFFFFLCADAFGIYVLFWMFGTICLIGFFFVLFKVPETQGKSLEDIERKMMGRIRRMSSVANIRPLSFNM